MRKIFLTEAQFKYLVSKSLDENFKLYTDTFDDVKVDVAECFPYLADNDNVPYEIKVRISYAYEPEQSGDRWVAPSGPYYTFNSCEPSEFDLKSWQELVANSGVPEEKLREDLEMYVEGHLEELVGKD